MAALVAWSLFAGVAGGVPKAAAPMKFPPPVQVGQQYWGTFYYPWYGGADDPWPDLYRAWGNDGHHPPSTWSSEYIPDNGSGLFDTANLYGSRDREVIDRHLVWMGQARFDFAAVSWWGPSSYEDRAFALMLDEASGPPTKATRLSILYEREGYSDPPVDRIVSDLAYLRDTYAGSDAFFAIPNGARRIPAVFVYGVDNAETVLRWAQARAILYGMNKPVFVVLGVPWSYAAYAFRPYASLVDGWFVYGAGRRVALVPGFSASASPGRAQIPELGNWPLFNRDPQEFSTAVRTLARLSAAQAKFLLVPTFNEWREGTQIEPGIPIHHNDSGAFSQAGPSYGTLDLDIVGSRGALLPLLPRPSAPGCAPPGPGLVSWWTGDGTAEDLAGFNMGTLYDRVYYAPGVVGSAFGFTGDGDWMLAPGMGIVDLQEFTIDFWVKLNAMPPGGIERMVSLTWAKAVVRYDGEGSRQLDFYMEIEGVLWHLRVNDLLEVGAFHHVAATYDGKVMQLYYDGKAVGSLAVHGRVSPAEGVALSTGGGEALDGLLDEVHVFKRALSPQEVSAIFGAGTAGLCTPDEGSLGSGNR